MCTQETHKAMDYYAGFTGNQNYSPSDTELYTLGLSDKEYCKEHPKLREGWILWDTISQGRVGINVSFTRQAALNEIEYYKRRAIKGGRPDIPLTSITNWIPRFRRLEY